MVSLPMVAGLVGNDWARKVLLEICVGGGVAKDVIFWRLVKLGRKCERFRARSGGEDNNV